MRSIRYLIVPGWHGSPDEHWQSHWQRTLPGSARVEQQDWLLPRREDWVAELQRSIAAHAEPVILVAHSLGCITVAHWAAQAPAQLLQRVRGALLVAPADVERSGCPEPLRNFAPIPRQPLPFATFAIRQPADRLGQRHCRQCRACRRDGPRLGQRDHDPGRRRAYQRGLRTSALGAGLRQPVPLAEPDRATCATARLNRYQPMPQPRKKGERR